MLGYLSNNPVAVNWRQFISRIKVIVLSNLISINVPNFSGWQGYINLSRREKMYRKNLIWSRQIQQIET